MKNTIFNDTVGASTQSEKLNIENSKGYSIQINITNASTLDITTKLQGSNDGLNWSDIPSTSNNITADTTVLINEENQYYEYVRVDIAWVSGSADVEIISKKKR